MIEDACGSLAILYHFETRQTLYPITIGDKSSNFDHQEGY